MSTIVLTLTLFGLICLVTILGVLLWALIESLSH
jgi:hypothetical protein